MTTNPTYRATRTCMFCADGCRFCQRQPSYPEWYTPSKSRGKANANVLSGLHPTGAKLSENFMTMNCGSCRHLRKYQPTTSRNYFYKCVKQRMSKSLSTDIRLSWAGCEHWSLTPHMNDGKVTMVQVL